MRMSLPFAVALLAAVGVAAPSVLLLSEIQKYETAVEEANKAYDAAVRKAWNARREAVLAAQKGALVELREELRKNKAGSDIAKSLDTAKRIYRLDPKDQTAIEILKAAGIELEWLAVEPPVENWTPPGIAPPEKNRKVLRIPADAVKWKEHHYKLYDRGCPYTIAIAICEQMGGHLVRIENPEEHGVIMGLLKHGTRVGYWIDGSDAEIEGRWVYSDGRPIVYSNWGQGEPNNGGGAHPEHWIHTDRRGVWNDTEAGIRDSGFICEWDE